MGIYPEADMLSDYFLDTSGKSWKKELVRKNLKGLAGGGFVYLRKRTGESGTGTTGIFPRISEEQVS